VNDIGIWKMQAGGSDFIEIFGLLNNIDLAD